jgi:hypothetical protein
MREVAVSHDLCWCVAWLIHMCDMTHSYGWHDSFICVTCLIRVCGRTHSYVLMGDMTHSYVLRISFVCVAGLTHMCDMSHSHLWHDSLISECSPTFAASERLSHLECCAFVCGIWLTHTWDMTHPLWDMTHAYVGHDPCIWYQIATQILYYLSGCCA